jgi:hypothetical protein
MRDGMTEGIATHAFNVCHLLRLNFPTTVEVVMTGSDNVPINALDVEVVTLSGH